MKDMFVNELLSEARKRLTTIGTESLLTDAARALSGSQTELVVVCDPDGKAVGVIAKADVVRRITHCEGAACKATVATAMTQRIVSCRPDDHVSAVWSKMKQHGLRHIPIIDDQSRPVGIINARDALQALLVNAVNEVELLRDYVTSMGYH
jgi:CBS domain-containing protein